MCQPSTKALTWANVMQTVQQKLNDHVADSDLKPASDDPTVQMFAFKPGIRDERELEFVVKIRVK